MEFKKPYSFDKLRSVTVVPDELLGRAKINILEDIDRQVELEFASKIFQELKTHKSVIVSLVKDKEKTASDNFETTITTDIKVFSVDDFIEHTLDYFSQLVDERLPPIYNSSPRYREGVYDALNVARLALKNLKSEIEK